MPPKGHWGVAGTGSLIPMIPASRPSAILVATLVRQVHKQATKGNGQALSRWLFAGQIAAALPWPAIGLLIGGGVLYSAGALLYARRWPDPWPRVFGYHEVFHALTIVAAIAHFIAIVAAVRLIP